MSLIYNNLEQFRMCLSRLKCGFCDGAILLSPPQEYASAPEFGQLEKSGYPVVCFDQWIPGKTFPVVSNDAERSIGLLTEKLLEQGMDAAFLDYQPDNTVADWRRECTEKLLRKAHIPYTCELDKIPELFRKYRVRNFGIYADTAGGLDRVEAKGISAVSAGSSTRGTRSCRNIVLRSSSAFRTSTEKAKRQSKSCST